MDFLCMEIAAQAEISPCAEQGGQKKDQDCFPRSSFFPGRRILVSAGSSGCRDLSGISPEGAMAGSFGRNPHLFLLCPLLFLLPGLLPGIFLLHGLLLQIVLLLIIFLRRHLPSAVGNLSCLRGNVIGCRLPGPHLLGLHLLIPDKLSVAACITLGAIATATAPAATLMVIK